DNHRSDTALQAQAALLADRPHPLAWVDDKSCCGLNPAHRRCLSPDTRLAGSSLPPVSLVHPSQQVRGFFAISNSIVSLPTIRSSSAIRSCSPLLSLSRSNACGPDATNCCFQLLI